MLRGQKPPAGEPACWCALSEANQGPQRRNWRCAVRGPGLGPCGTRGSTVVRGNNLTIPSHACAPRWIYIGDQHRYSQCEGGLMPIVIEGKHPLEGEVEIGGAKNAALPVIAATLLTADECLLENVPFIEDIRTMMQMLQHLGVAARFAVPNTVRIKATRISTASLPQELTRRMRAGFLIVGPLLARFGQAESFHPGGCSIGTRPVSVDVKGFQIMGGEIESREESYLIRARRLQGQRLILDYPSHTGTENLLMAACLAEGVTYIENASVEPEVVDLANFPCSMGARIYGAGTSNIQIEGTPRLHGGVYRVMPDRMAAGTFALCALITGGKVRMEGAVSHWLGALTNKMKEAGAEVTATPDTYEINTPRTLRAGGIQTSPYTRVPT